MADIKAKCPGCGSVLRVRQDALGGKVRCPKCERKFRISKPSAPASAPPPASSPDEYGLAEGPEDAAGEQAGSAAPHARGPAAVGRAAPRAAVPPARAPGWVTGLAIAMIATSVTVVAFQGAPAFAVLGVVLLVTGLPVFAACGYPWARRVMGPVGRFLAAFTYGAVMGGLSGGSDATGRFEGGRKLDELEKRARGRKPGRRRAPTAMLLTVAIWLLVSAVFAASATYGLSRRVAPDQAAGRAPRRISVNWGRDGLACREHLKVVGLAFYNYAEENNRRFPECKAWCDVAARHVPNRPASNFDCPGRPSGGYAMNAHLAGRSLRRLRDIGRTVLAFEADVQRNTCATRERLIARPRHGNAFVILFADGRVKGIPAPELDRLIWDPDNPPPPPEQDKPDEDTPAS